MNTMKDNIVIGDARNDSTDELKRAYHAPEMVEHGELTQLTKGAGGAGSDGVGYSVIP